MRRIGMLTSGGDCQALNATMRGVGKVLYNKLDEVEILGFRDGYRGLIQFFRNPDDGRDHSRFLASAF